MKNTITTTKTCLLALTLTATSHAQTHYDWTMSDDIAHWGDGPKYSSEGSYTRNYVIWSGANMGKSGAADGHMEGPYDGTSGAILGIASTGISTRTDPNAIFDLSAVGSSATIRTAYHAIGSTNDTGGGGHLYQFGLTNNSSYFGAPDDESLLVAADFKGYDVGTDTVTLDLSVFDQTGLDTTGDGTWAPTALANIENNLTIDRIYHGSGNSHAIELTYTNIGNGQLRMDIGIMDLFISGRNASDVVTSTSQVVQQSHIINHSFSDLSALRPGFGLAINDSDIPMSAANFDWEDAYPTNFAPIPEPSSASLLGLGIAGFLLRRKRK